VADARYRWVVPAPVTVDPAVVEAGRRAGLSDRLIGLLAARGIADATEIERFVGPPAAGLHDPWLLPDAAAFVERVERARSAGERVMVFGDFDADGLTGLAIVVRALRARGIDVVPYVPSRIDEGHGLSRAAIDAAIAASVSVIVTVDCGSTSGPEIAEAAGQGIDVLVTDHHRVPADPPPAAALVNPHRPDSAYPDRRLSGAGVAFKVAALLTGDAAHDDADLATIGAVSDVAPILGENRAIARLGLERIRTAPRPGIAALLARAGVDHAQADLETIGFAVAPRLNAAGRVGEALDAARLLLAEDPAEAAALAEALEAANRTRRDLMRVAVDEARALVPVDLAEPAVVVRGDWPVGIVGLVASRLAEDLGRPAIVGANLGGNVRASCRSDGRLDLAATLESCADLFTRHGGHAGAAGFELPVDAWDAFRGRFLALAAAGVAAETDPRRALRVDLVLPAMEVDYALLRELGSLAPCGSGNPEPLVAILGLTVTRVRAASGGHSQLTLRRTLDVLDGIAFDRADLAESIREGDRVDVVGRVMSRRFGGYESLQVEIRDVATSGTAIEAPRVALPVAPAVALADPLLAGGAS
jgi:single-stranded-DNA-specific exonuclease